MDIKFNKKRLNDHLSYDWWKYLAILIACIFFWSLIFTVSAPRLAMSKKMEIFFISSNYSAEKSEHFRSAITNRLSDEFIEFDFSSYIPGDEVTPQVLSARTYVKEGDLYMLPFSETISENLYGSYVDQNLFYDFERIIGDAKEFYADRITEFEVFKEQCGGQKEYNTEEKLQKGWEVYTSTCERANTEALKLEEYIETYGNYTSENGNKLFYKYNRFSVYKNSNPDDDVELENEKIWGINYNALADKGIISDFSKGGFMYLNPVSGDGERAPLNVAMGIVSFAEENMPLYYENIAVINYTIEKYFIGNID